MSSPLARSKSQPGGYEKAGRWAKEDRGAGDGTVVGVEDRGRHAGGEAERRVELAEKEQSDAAEESDGSGAAAVKDGDKSIHGGMGKA